MMRVVGAGLGRTGTLSLKVALERLLSGRCYHMMELFGRPQDLPLWHGAARGDMPDWRELLSEYDAAVDWPASAFWPELAEAFPDAIILLSTRPAEDWWRSANATIFEGFRSGEPPEQEALRPWFEMVSDMFTSRFTPSVHDRDASIAAFEAHNQQVRRTAPAERLLDPPGQHVPRLVVPGHRVSRRPS